MHGEFGLGSQTKSIKHLSAHNPTISIGSLNSHQDLYCLRNCQRPRGAGGSLARSPDVHGRNMSCVW